MSEYKREYSEIYPTSNDKYGIYYAYAVSNEKGTVHFWCQKSTFDNEYFGGVETHYIKPPYYMKDNEPSHQICRYLLASCWHDGSSLASDEYIKLHKKNYKQEIFARLIDRAEDHWEMYKE